MTPIDTSKSAFPKPGATKQKRPASKVHRDSRLVWDQTTKEGKRGYRLAIDFMWRRQGGVCCDCGLWLDRYEATFEHEGGRGGGRRDDRIYVRDHRGRLKRQNGAAHGLCNSERNSKRTELIQFPKQGFTLRKVGRV